MTAAKPDTARHWRQSRPDTHAAQCERVVAEQRSGARFTSQACRARDEGDDQAMRNETRTAL